jgi:TetR/AcrR family transcriptional repressor of mexJK operon
VTVQAKNRVRETLSARKERSILRAATEVFLARGFLAASMDEIAAAAAVSKATVYNHFGSKRALFEAIVRDRCDALISPLRLEPPAGATLDESLKSLAHQYLGLLLDPASLALHRILVFEAAGSGEIGAAAYRAGGAPVVDRIAEFLTRQVRAGRLEMDDPALAAEQFLGALTGYIQARALLGVEPNPSPAKRKKAIATAVSAFLRAYGADDRSARRPAVK